MPGEKTGGKSEPGHLVWQRGPWLLVDRVSGQVTALKLPHYDTAASQVARFRDYAAYCGISATGKSLYAVAAPDRRPQARLFEETLSLRRRKSPLAGVRATRVAARAVEGTFHPAGRDPASYDLVGGSAGLVEEDDEPEAHAKP